MRVASIKLVVKWGAVVCSSIVLEPCLVVQAAQKSMRLKPPYFLCSAKPGQAPITVYDNPDGGAVANIADKHSVYVLPSKSDDADKPPKDWAQVGEGKNHLWKPLGWVRSAGLNCISSDLAGASKNGAGHDHYDPTALSNQAIKNLLGKAK